MAETTVSLIKADVGSVAGHTLPHPEMMEVAKSVLKDGVKRGTIGDFMMAKCGDDMALTMTHDKGENDEGVHKLAWDAFLAAADVARKMGLYGAGQDLLVESFSGNIRGMGPGIAEITFKERPSEPIVAFLADKTEPSAFNLPMARIFADPFTTSGLVIDPKLHDGFIFEVLDVKEKLMIELKIPEELHDLLALIGDITRYAIKRIRSKNPEIGPAAVLSTEKLSLIAGKYVGKDDPVALVRAQSGLPAVGEILQPFAFPQLVSGWMRGSHWGAWYPSSQADAIPSYFDGPPRIVALGFHVKEGRIHGLEEGDAEPGEHIPVDYFDGTAWNWVRSKAMEISVYIRGHGPFMPAILPPEELEYTTRPQVLEKLKGKFKKVE